MHPAAALVAEAARREAYTVEINLEPTPASEHVDLTIHGPAEVLLGQLEDLLTRSDRQPSPGE